MLTILDIRSFLPEAAKAARVQPCHEPVVDGSWYGNATALAERRPR